VLTLLSGDVAPRARCAERWRASTANRPPRAIIQAGAGTASNEALRHLFKIDYYDASMEFGSEDPADLSKKTRVLTIMLAEDWRGGLLLAGFRGGFPRPRPTFFF